MYQITVNCNIHLGFKMKEKSTKDLTYMQVISPNVVSSVSRVKGGRLDFLWIKDLKPNGVSLYIHNGMGSTSPY